MMRVPDAMSDLLDCSSCERALVECVEADNQHASRPSIQTI